MRCVNMNIMSVRNTYSPKLRLLAYLGNRSVAWIVVGVVAHGGSWCGFLGLQGCHYCCVVSSGLALKNKISSLAMIIKESRHSQICVHHGFLIKHQFIGEIIRFTLKDLMTLHSIKV